MLLTQISAVVATSAADPIPPAWASRRAGILPAARSPRPPAKIRIVPGITGTTVPISPMTMSNKAKTSDDRCSGVLPLVQSILGPGVYPSCTVVFRCAARLPPMAVLGGELCAQQQDHGAEIAHSKKADDGPYRTVDQAVAAQSWPGTRCRAAGPLPRRARQPVHPARRRASSPVAGNGAVEDDEGHHADKDRRHQ